MTTLPYNKFSKESICEYANKLVGMSFREVLKNNSEISDSDKIKLYKYYNKVGSKGSLGNLIEEHYFLYKPNSEKKLISVKQELN